MLERASAIEAKIALVRLASALVVCGLATTSCAHRRVVVASCRTADEPTQPVHVPPPADLTAARDYYDYVAVTEVEPAGEHFTVWYHDVEPVFERLRVAQRPSGGLDIVSEGGMFGGIGGPPQPAPMSASVAALAGELGATLRARCPQGRNWQLRYGGHSRTVTVREFIPHDSSRRGAMRGGWSVMLAVAMDEALTRIEGIVEQRSGFGVIEVPEGAQWLEVAQGGPERLRLDGGLDAELREKIAAAAQRWADARPGPALASLVPTDAPMLPAGFVARVLARLVISGGMPSELRIPLDVRRAVFGPEADGDADFRTPTGRYSVHVALLPNTLLVPSPERRSMRYDGTLNVRIADGLGQVWQRDYPASGSLDTQGEDAAMPTGLVLPGASAPSAAEQALHIKLGDSLEARVDVELFDDPRRH